MNANLSNRKTYREALAALLQTKLVTELGYVDAVYSYLKGDYADGVAKAVMIASGPISRSERNTNEPDAIFTLDIIVDLPYAEEGNASWDEQDSEDALDNIEKAVTEVCRDNTTNQVRYSRTEPTEPGVIKDRRFEIIPIRVEVLE